MWDNAQTWLLPIATGIGGALSTFIPNVIKWKKSTTDTFQGIIGELRERGDSRDSRIDSLESLIQQTRDHYEQSLHALRHDHIECEKKHSYLSAKIEMLEKVNLAKT
jgi:hypothetical protein